jgi:hypothetical protein
VHCSLSVSSANYQLDRPEDLGELNLKRVTYTVSYQFYSRWKLFFKLTRDLADAYSFGIYDKKIRGSTAERPYSAARRSVWIGETFHITLWSCRKNSDQDVKTTYFCRNIISWKRRVKPGCFRAQHERADLGFPILEFLYGMFPLHCSRRIMEICYKGTVINP